MEKISAACAMEWSIELEKGLRSKKPGEPIAAIERVAPKLREWSREPHITLGVSRMYGMMQGEDRMFANAILLRLADAFRTGNKEMKYAIIKVFVLELKDIMSKGRRYDGMLVKWRVPNYMELLRRVKCVYDSGDVEDRALSLRLYGCWADLVRENADVRYIILSSLQSSDVLEVKASIFAAGCICRLSEDFACIALGMFVDIVCSKASCNVKIAAARAFSKMMCSSFIVNRAYKVGRNLLSSLDVDEVILEMLSSLSKLASKSVMLLPTQVECVTSFLSQEYSSVLNARALKCFCFLFRGRAQHITFSWDVVTSLFSMIDDICLLVDSHCDILRVLWKVFQYSLPNVPAMVVPGFLKFISVMVSIARSCDIHKQYFALGLLVEISCSFKYLVPQDWSIGDLLSLECLQVLGFGSGESCSLHFAHCVTVLIIDVIISSLKYANADANGMEFSQILTISDTSPKLKYEFRMFYFLLHLVEEYPELFPMMITKINSFLQDLAKLQYTSNKEAHILGEASQEDMNIDKESSSYGLLESDGNYNESVALEMVTYMCRFVKCCVKVLDRVGAFTSEVNKVVTHFREHVDKCFLGDSIPYQVFSLHLQSLVVSNLCGINKETTDAADNSEDATGSSICIPQNNQWVHHEYIALEFSKQMFKRRNKWALYRAGMMSACNGLWLAATFSFRKLVQNVKSDACNSWLRSLMLLAGAESEIKLLLYPKLSISLINWLQHDNACGNSYSEVENIIGQSIDASVHLYQLDKKIARISERIHTSELILKSAKASDDIFCFQSWFLRLRAKVLEVLVDLISLLSSPICLEQILHCSDLSEKNMVKSLQIVTQELESVALQFVGITFQLKSLAVEYDLLATSFMDIDQSSSQTIARLSLTCSLLAFCTSFPIFFAKSLTTEDTTSGGFSSLQNFSNMEVAQDLTERLWDIDNDCVMNLQKNLSFHGDCHWHMQSRSHISSSGHADNGTIMVCRFATSHFQHLYGRVKEASGFGNFYQLFKEGIQLLNDVVIKWMDLSIPVPRYFFQPRLCISLELFIFTSNSSCSTKVSISPGTQLSLNLCIQLRNASADIIAKITKIYCILAVRPSDCFFDLDSGKQDFCMSQAWENGVMVDLNERLLHFINNDVNTVRVNCIESSGMTPWVTSFVCFEPSEKGLGFSSCLLDVSTFPEGTYLINWQGCCTNAEGTCWNLLPTNAASFNIKSSCI